MSAARLPPPTASERGDAAREAAEESLVPSPLPGGLSIRSLTLEQKWFRQFFVGILICVNNGACFTFGIFSPFMKQGGFRYTQTQVNVVSTVGVFLSYFSVPNGFLYDNYGPQATLLAGTILNVTGWAGMFLIFLKMEHPILTNSVVVMSLFYALSQFSASFYETGSVLTNLRAFSCYKGRVVVIQKTFMGLGSSIVAQVYVAFFEPTFSTIAPFFLFLALFSAVAGFLSVRYVRLPGPGTWCLGLNVPDLATITRGGGESTMFDRPFNIGTVILVFAVAYVLLVSLVENFVPELSAVGRALIGITTLGLVSSFVSMIVCTPSYAENVGGFHESAEGAAKRAALLDTGAVFSPTTVAMEGVAVEAERPHAPLSETGVMMMAETPRHKALAASDAEEEELPVGGEGHTGLRSGRPHITIELPQPSSWKRQRSYGGVEAPARQRVSPEAAVTPSSPSKAPEGGGDPRHDGSTASPVNEGGGGPAAIVLNDAPLLTNLSHCDIWLLWYICFASWGSMTLVSSNSSQIYQAVAYDDFSLTVNTVFVSIYGVASALGRILVGAGQPIMERRRIPIASFLIAAPVLNVVGLPAFLFSSSGGLFLPFFIVGFATGVSWGSTVLVVTAFFVINNAGKHYSWLYTAGMLSPLVFNIGLFGPVYGYHSRLQGREEDHSCKGSICIRAPLLVCIAINLAAIPCAYHFTRRTSRRGGVRV